MSYQRALVTNPDHYVSTVVCLILAASAVALVVGIVAGLGF